MSRTIRWLAGLLCLGFSGSAHANPDVLWHFVHDRCTVEAAASGDPFPCDVVAYPQGADSGYVVFKDRTGAAQYLVIPTAKITGIEDPAILAANATNYLQEAWAARGFFLKRIGHDLPRDAISLAINSPYGRSQNQLHIHIDCVAASVRAALQPRLASIARFWAPLGVALNGHLYRALRLDSADLAGVNPFFELAGDASVGAAGIHTHTLVVVGAHFPDGQDGFVLLDDHLDAAPGDPASGEELQDHDCAVAK